MSIEIKLSKKRIPYKKAMLFLKKRVEGVKNGDNRELIWMVFTSRNRDATVRFICFALSIRISFSRGIALCNIVRHVAPHDNTSSKGRSMFNKQHNISIMNQIRKSILMV